MSWIDTLWPVMNGASLALALIYFFVWLKQRNQPIPLVVVAIALTSAAIGIIEHDLLRASTPEHYEVFLRWAHVPFAINLIAVIYFVNRHLKLGRAWLGNLAITARLLCVAANFTTGANLNFTEVTSLDLIPFPGGEYVVFPVGTPNPWLVLAQIAHALFIAFLVDAFLSARKIANANNRWRALFVIAGLILFVLALWLWTFNVVMGLVHAPLLFEPFFLLVLLIISYEMGSEVLDSAETKQQLLAAQSDLYKNQERMDIALNAAGVGFLEWDFSTGKVMLSEVSSNALGLAPKGSYTSSEFIAAFHPEDRTRIEKILEAPADAREFAFECRISGSGYYDRRWVGSRGRVDFNTNGSAIRIYGVLGDITARKRTDEKFQLVLEAAPNAMLVVNDDGVITFSNWYADTVFGYARNEMIGMKMDMLIPSGNKKAVELNWLPNLSKSSAQVIGYGRELIGLRKDGAEFSLEASFSPIPLETETLNIFTIVDITERKRVTQQIETNRIELAHLSRVALIAELSGSLAHELNQPLTAILSNAQAGIRFMNQTPPNLAEVNESLVNIVESDKRAGDVIRRLRAMLRKEPVTSKDVDINDAVRTVVRILGSDLALRGIEVEMQLMPESAIVEGDAIQLQQVILNLIINGCDAMNTLTATRKITIVTARNSDSGIEVMISDLGTGLTAPDSENMFEPFVTSKPDGMGLGLTICRSIMLAHRGRLWLTNNPEKGATSHMLLPSPEPRET